MNIQERTCLKFVTLGLFSFLLSILFCAQGNAGVPSDAEEWCGHYYKVYQMEKTAPEAEQYCKSMGGYLASMTNEGERDLFYSLIQNVTGGNAALVGGTDRAQEKKWEWMSGEDWTYYPYSYELSNLRYSGGGEEKNYIIFRNNPVYGASGYWGFQIVENTYACPLFICEWGGRIDLGNLRADSFKLSADRFIYKGTAQKPTVSVCYNGDKFLPLYEGQDYTLTHVNNVNPGTARVIINGIGRYTGTVTRTYTIDTAKDLSKAAVTLSQTEYTYDGKAKEPSVTVTAEGKTLLKDKDYSVSYNYNNRVGTATVYVKGIGDNYGETSKAFIIKLATPQISSVTSTKHGQVKAVSKTVKGAEGYVFTFTPVTKAKKTVLVSGSEKKVTSKQVVPGAKYKVKVRARVSRDGKYIYSDYSAEKTITIFNNNDLKKASVKLSKTSYKYDGKAKEPSVTVKLNNKKLKKGTDYTVTYKSNKDPGTATVVVKGKGDYKGSKNLTFKITGSKKNSKTTAVKGEKKNKNSAQTVIPSIATEADVKEDFAVRLKESIWIYEKIKEDTLAEVSNSFVNALGFQSESIKDGSAEVVTKMLTEHALKMLEESPSTFTSCKDDPNQIVKKILDDLTSENGIYSFKGEDGEQYTITYEKIGSKWFGGAFIQGKIKKGTGWKNGKSTTYSFGGAQYSKSRINDAMADLKALADAKIDDAVDAAIGDAKTLLKSSEIEKIIKKTANDKIYGEITKNAGTNIANKTKEMLTFVKKAKDLRGAYDGIKSFSASDIASYNKKLEAYINAVDALF